MSAESLKQYTFTVEPLIFEAFSDYYDFESQNLNIQTLLPKFKLIIDFVDSNLKFVIIPEDKKVITPSFTIMLPLKLVKIFSDGNIIPNESEAEVTIKNFEFMKQLYTLSIAGIGITFKKYEIPFDPELTNVLHDLNIMSMLPNESYTVPCAKNNGLFSGIKFYTSQKKYIFEITKENKRYEAYGFKQKLGKIIIELHPTKFTSTELPKEELKQLIKQQLMLI